MIKMLPKKTQLNIDFRIDKNKNGLNPNKYVEEYLYIGILFLDKSKKVIENKTWDISKKPSSNQGLMLKKSNNGFLVILKNIPENVFYIKCILGIKNPNKQYKSFSDYPICNVCVTRADDLENKQYMLYNFNYKESKLATVNLLERKNNEWKYSMNHPEFYKDNYEKAKLNIKKEIKTY